MRLSEMVFATLCGAALLAGSGAARAEVLTYHAALDGRYGSEPSGSAATGDAEIKVDTELRTVSINLVVDGIAPDALWEKLVAAPIGPVHLHKYATAEGGDSVLVVPFPFGESYRATKTGLQVTTANTPYDTAAALVKSTLSFDQFLAAMRDGLIVVNIHTNAFNAGEISGRIGGGAYPGQPGSAHRH